MPPFFLQCGTMDVAVRELQPAELPAAVALVARGMRDNPLNVQAMGMNAEARLSRLQAMFAAVLPMTARKGSMLGTFDDGHLVGVLAWVPSGRCQATLGEKVALAARMVPRIGVGALLRIARGQGDWEKRDPAETHWHLGRVSVDSGLRGRRIGSALMANYCARLDAERVCSYLETDKAENLRFYAKFGFSSVAEAKVLGVSNWFMVRPAGA